MTSASASREREGLLGEYYIIYVVHTGNLSTRGPIVGLLRFGMLPTNSAIIRRGQTLISQPNASPQSDDPVCAYICTCGTTSMYLRYAYLHYDNPSSNGMACFLLLHIVTLTCMFSARSPVSAQVLEKILPAAAAPTMDYSYVEN